MQLYQRWYILSNLVQIIEKFVVQIRKCLPLLQIFNIYLAGLFSESRGCLLSRLRDILKKKSFTNKRNEINIKQPLRDAMASQCRVKVM